MHISAKLLLGVIITSIVVSILIDTYLLHFSIVTFLSYLFGIVVYTMLVLDQHCVAEGNCGTWTWVKVSITSLLILILMYYKVYRFIQIVKRKKKNL
jgi:hypothetical protein